MSEPNEGPAKLRWDAVRPAGLRTEVAVVLGLSLGASAVYSLLAIVERLTRAIALNQQTSSLNTAVTPDRPWLDLAYQLVGIGLHLMPVALALYLLASVCRPLPRAQGSIPAFVGLDLRRPGWDLGSGLALAAIIGIPGLGLYLAARALGFNTSVAAANLGGAWWTIPVLILAAAQNALLEEVVMVGYLFTRLGQLRWRSWPIILASAVIRGTYHLYQGFGGFVGNIAMGIILGLFYRRTQRVMPLVIAHTVLDVVSFVGYSALRGKVGWL